MIHSLRPLINSDPLSSDCFWMFFFVVFFLKNLSIQQALVTVKPFQLFSWYMLMQNVIHSFQLFFTFFFLNCEE